MSALAHQHLITKRDASRTYLPFISAPFILDTVVLISPMYASFLTYSSSGLVFDRHCMTEFMKHVFPMFLRPFRPICLIPIIGDDISSPTASLFLSLVVVVVVRLFNEEGEEVEELPARAFLLILGEEEMS